MTSDTIYILGLAGTRCLIQTLENIIKHDDRKKILIARHCFSIGTLDKPSNISHNQMIIFRNQMIISRNQMIIFRNRVTSN